MKKIVIENIVSIVLLILALYIACDNFDQMQVASMQYYLGLLGIYLLFMFILGVGTTKFDETKLYRILIFSCFSFLQSVLHKEPLKILN